VGGAIPPGLSREPKGAAPPGLTSEEGARREGGASTAPGGERDQQSEWENTVSCLSVTFLRGRTGARRTLRHLGVLWPAALAVATVLGGCSAPAAAPAAGSEHGLTLAQARAAYGAYVTASTAAAKEGDAARGLAIVADAQWAVLHAQYTALSISGTPVARYSYGTPTFYVPALSGYPQWFMAAVPVSTVTGGQPGAAVNTLMVFVRPARNAPWTLDGSAALDQPLPAIARDRDGYAISVGTTDASLLLQPNIVGPAQAAVVDEGPAAPAAAVMGGGPQTTELYAQQAALGNAATTRGLSYQWLLEGAAFAQWELRTADGGALVLYTMYLNTTTEHPGNVAGSPISVPPAFGPLITTSARAGRHGMTANWTYEFAAIDPPQTARGAKVEVIAGSGAPTYGRGY
jgi:hypothetical protein